MNLQTKIPLKAERNQIDYNSKVLLLGSCFAENIGDKFEYFKFQNLVNPFGILFNPIAIQQLVGNAIKSKQYKDDDVFLNNEQFHCFDAHSQLSSFLKEELIQDLNRQLELTNQQITKSTHIIITLGTAWVYRLLETDKVVANCHKTPQKQFKKELLSVDLIETTLLSIIKQLKVVNPKVTIIFTVSPVRHIKDGFVENTQSKSHLITAIHKVLEDDVSYFPSYEIMMDELRDYRFYNQDMLHPNPLAVNYIWEGFKSVWINKTSEKTMNLVDTIQKGLSHKPFNKDSESYRKFVEQLDNKMSVLQSQFMHIQF